MAHLRVQLDMFVYELTKVFCSDWLEFSAFCSEVLLCLCVFSFYSWLSCSAARSHVSLYLPGCTASLCLLTLFFVKVALHLNAILHSQVICHSVLSF